MHSLTFSMANRLHLYIILLLLLTYLFWSIIIYRQQNVYKKITTRPIPCLEKCFKFIAINVTLLEKKGFL